MLVEDVVVFDITREASTLLSALLLARRSDAADEDERARWASRRLLVKHQTRALDPTDRTWLIGQQQAWMRQAHDLS